MKDRNVKLVHLYVKDKKGKTFAASMMYRNPSDVRNLYSALRIYAECTLEEVESGFRLTMERRK